VREALDRVLKGAVDFHLHASPDPYIERCCDSLEVALRAKDMGMRAIVLKSHDYPTTPVARVIEGVVEGIRTVGGVVLNYGVGGINPWAVEASARMGGKVVWMPTLSSLQERRRRGLEGGITILGEDGGLIPQAREVLALVKEYGLVLCTGHISREEVFALIGEALRMGIGKIVITHPMLETFGTPLDLEVQKELSERGAFIEHCFVAVMPFFGRLEPRRLTEAIRAVGAERCILSTDLGQLPNPSPWEGMRMMIATMLEAGLSEGELEFVVKRNPAQLLDLDTEV